MKFYRQDYKGIINKLFTHLFVVKESRIKRRSNGESIVELQGEISHATSDVKAAFIRIVKSGRRSRSESISAFIGEDIL